MQLLDKSAESHGKITNVDVPKITTGFMILVISHKINQYF